MVSSPPPNVPNSGPCRNNSPALSRLKRLTRKPSRLCHTSSFVPSVVNPCSSNMICLRLPVVRPSVRMVPVLPWIGQRIFCHLSLFGICNNRFETFSRWASYAHEGSFSCTMLLLNQPTVPAIDFLSCWSSFTPQAGRGGIGRAA